MKYRVKHVEFDDNLNRVEWFEYLTEAELKKNKETEHTDSHGYHWDYEAMFDDEGMYFYATRTTHQLY